MSEPLRPPRTLLHVFSTFGVGGPQVRMVRLVNHFGKKYRHRIVAMDGVTTAFDAIAPGVDAEMLSVPNYRNAIWSNIGAYRRLLDEVRPDVLVTSNWGSIEWAAANRFGHIDHVHMEDGFGLQEAQTQLARRMWARRLLLRRATVVLPSRVLLRIARDKWRLPLRNLLYLPNGVECARFQVSADPQFLSSAGIDANLPVVGTVATLRAEKNLGRLIDAFAAVVKELPAQLVIVGDGQERTNLVARAAQRGVSARVLFTGACPAPEKFLAGFDVFAISSDTEQMPLSVLEAMAAGRPLAATDVGDIRQMVAESNRPFLVEKDSARLADAILALLKDRQRASDIGAANAERAVTTFDESRMFAAYGALFDGARPSAVQVVA